MSAFLDDHAEDMKNPKYAYQFGRSERELEIIKLLESDPKELIDLGGGLRAGYETAIALIKGEK